MPSSSRRIGTYLILSTLLLSACQAAPVPPAPIAVPSETPAPSATPAPTAVPNHPAVKPDAVRIDFSNTTMTSSPGDIEPGADMQVVFNAAANQYVKVELTIESGAGAVLSVWGVDGTLLVPETIGITVWEGTMPSAQDYYLNIRNVSQQMITYQMVMIMRPMVLPEATRIQFQPNTTGWNTPGEIGPNSQMHFVLGANADQQMTVSLITTPADSETYLHIWGADGTVYTLMAPSKEWTGQLPATQDYYIDIRSYAKQAVTYQLSVNIPAVGDAVNAPVAIPEAALGAKISKYQSIRFAEGPLDFEVSGAVISGERDLYALNILAGETLDVIITSQEGNAVFTIIGPDNNPLPGTEEGKDTNNWSVPITVEGTYSILVGPTRGNATYTLKVKI
jgi:hypothetical protein